MCPEPTEEKLKSLACTKFGEMNPSTIKATLKVMGLCVVVLFLAAAVTLSVAVIFWNSDAVQKWRECQARVRNGTARLAELEGEVENLRKRLENGLRKETELRQELSFANHDMRRLGSALATCQNHTEMLQENLTAAQYAISTARMDYTDAETKNDALRVDLDTCKGQVSNISQVLEKARVDYQNVTENHQEAERQREQCRGQHNHLNDTVKAYAAEVEQLRQQLSSSSAGHRCQLSWQLLALGVSSLLFLMG